jgi:hypothetical protein
MENFMIKKMIKIKWNRRLEKKRKKKVSEKIDWQSGVSDKVKNLTGNYLPIPFLRVGNQVTMVSHRLAHINDAIGVARQTSNLTD